MAQQQLVDQLSAELTDRLAELRVVKGSLEVEKIRAEEANAELRWVNERTQGFTAVAAHDLRSPLQSIVGFADMLGENWATLKEDDRKKFVAIIVRQAHTLSTLVEDLLTMSSIEAGGLNERPQPVELRATIDHYLEAGGEKTATVSVSCPPDLVVRVDPQHLGRILDNYVQNAFKYGEPPVRIEADRVGDLVEMRVLDHGPGVPPDFVPRLFGKFARADTAGTRAQKGLGLGLSIVRGLAEANSGRARYQPNTPHGGCFVVELPAGGLESPDTEGLRG